MGRERLFRYGLRLAFAGARLRFLPDGNLAYRVNKPGRGGQAKHRFSRNASAGPTSPSAKT